MENSLLKTWTVDTVGYSIQICWLLKFLLKPMVTTYVISGPCSVHPIITWVKNAAPVMTNWQATKAISVLILVCGKQ